MYTCVNLSKAIWDDLKVVYALKLSWLLSNFTRQLDYAYKLS